MESGSFKNWMEWKEWNKAQKLMVEEPVPSRPAATHDTSNENLSTTQNRPSGTSCTATFGNPNVGRSQGIRYKKPNYKQRPTSVYRQPRIFHPFTSTSGLTFSYKKRDHTFTENQYSTAKNSFKWINPDAKNKKDNNSVTDTSSASSSSGE